MTGFDKREEELAGRRAAVERRRAACERRPHRYQLRLHGRPPLPHRHHVQPLRARRQTPPPRGAAAVSPRGAAVSGAAVQSAARLDGRARGTRRRVLSPRGILGRRVAAAPRPRRGYSVGTGRGAAAAATWICRRRVAAVSLFRGESARREVRPRRDPTRSSSSRAGANTTSPTTTRRRPPSSRGGWERATRGSRSTDISGRSWATCSCPGSSGTRRTTRATCGCRPDARRPSDLDKCTKTLSCCPSCCPTLSGGTRRGGAAGATRNIRGRRIAATPARVPRGISKGRRIWRRISGGDASRRRHGCHVEYPRGRVAATPRMPRGTS